MNMITDFRIYVITAITATLEGDNHSLLMYDGPWPWSQAVKRLGSISCLQCCLG